MKTECGVQLMIPVDEATVPLEEMLVHLERAVRDGDRDEAIRSERIILQRLVLEARERENVERRAREVMAQLDHRVAQTSRFSVDAELGARPRTEAVIYPVWFCTNRAPTVDGATFTGIRHNKVTRGRVDVVVPAAHRFGEIGSPLWKRLYRFDLRDDHLRVEQLEIQERENFFYDIRRKMTVVRESRETPHGLVFLHGYNVSFADAAIRAAQIGWDLKVPGATAFFSWPSRGFAQAYPVDEASIEASEAAVTDFLVDFATNCGAEKVHVIAHSMGNRGLLRALQRIAGNAATRGKIKFGQIFLAAPDVDRDLFLDLAALYPEHAERATLYTSSADVAVHLSSRVHDAPRAGYFAPYTVATGIDTIAVPNFDVDLLGHSYYAQAEALLYDIRDLMRHNEDPSTRQRIESAQDGGAKFWSLRR
jgi:esterase/lipase superfamily enzyme